MATNDGSVVVSVRLPAGWGARIDEQAAKLGSEIGTRFDRSDIVRIALSRYLGLTEDEERPVPAPT